jgi:hypothetical protein
MHSPGLWPVLAPAAGLSPDWSADRWVLLWARPCSTTPRPGGSARPARSASRGSAKRRNPMAPRAQAGRVRTGSASPPQYHPAVLTTDRHAASRAAPRPRPASPATSAAARRARSSVPRLSARARPARRGGNATRNPARARRAAARMAVPGVVEQQVSAAIPPGSAQIPPLASASVLPGCRPARIPVPASPAPMGRTVTRARAVARSSSEACRRATKRQLLSHACPGLLSPSGSAS